MQRIIGWVFAAVAFGWALVTQDAPEGISAKVCAWAGPRREFCQTHLPHWLDQWAWLVLVVLAGAAIVAFVAPHIRPLLRRIHQPYVPIGLAVQYAYDETDAAFRSPAFALTVPSAADRLEWLAYSLLAHRGGSMRVAMIGRRVPATKPEQLTDADLRHVHWRPGTNALADDLVPSSLTIFDDVHVNRRDLQRHVRTLKSDATMLGKA